ncbi:MAG: hypothetical protein EOO85_29050 [Pedobacter sp.]|nr:MAG: hypothetical protein EOO85_29050 [Pedobacter sp.]
MKEILIAIAICLITTGPKAVAQQEEPTNDLFMIHSAVLTSLDKRNHRYNIIEKIDKVYLRYFDFTLESILFRKKEHIANKSDWQAFIKGIDTAKLEDYKLSTDKSFWSKYHMKIKSRYTKIVFAPVMIAPDKRKALCIFHIFQSVNSGSYMAAYLEFNDGKWQVKKFDTFVYLD